VAAFFEEVIFRRGTKSWKDGSIRGLIFGLIHLTMGVPLIIAVVPLTLMGFWFTREYFEGTRRFKEQQRIDELALENGNNREYEEDDEDGRRTLQKVRFCSWNPFAGKTCTDVEAAQYQLLETASVARSAVGESNIQPEREREQPQEEDDDILKRLAREARNKTKNAGTKASALLHLGHNLVAISVTFILLVVSQFVSIPGF